MTLPIEYDPLALRAIRDARRWYARAGAGLSGRFTAAFDAAIAVARNAPGVCTPHVEGTRLSRVRKFPYGVVFVEEPTRILVLALAHSRRRQGYWRRRLP
jgi:plasmid stabilization system protein ParE